MHSQVREQVHRLLTERQRRRQSRRKRLSMTGQTTDLRSQRVPILNRRRARCPRTRRQRRSQEAHECTERGNIRWSNAAYGKAGVALRQSILGAIRIVLAFIWKYFIRYAHFNVVSFAAKDGKGLVLRLPAKASNAAVVWIRIHRAANETDIDLAFHSILRFLPG